MNTTAAIVIRAPRKADHRGIKTAALVVALTFLSFAAIAQGPPPPPPPPQALPPVPFPPENPYSEAKRVLGKILFWDEQLSTDNTVACGTCHRPSFAGGDPRLGLHPGADGQFGTVDDIIGSPGVVRRNSAGEPINDPIFGFDPQVTGRNAPPYFAAMFAPDSFWDGRADSTFINPENGGTAIQTGGALESQAVGPILSSAEMACDGRTWDDVRAKLTSVTPMLLASNIPPDVQLALDAAPTYAQLFTTAFGTPTINARRIAFAIATYERTLVANQTPWDAFIAGNPNALTNAQRQGWDFLRNNTVCLACHRPPQFTDDNFHNIGLRPAAEDIGRQAVTGNNNDRGRFKTPSLRNVGLRDTLMHVGWITDVQDALNFYNAGTQNTGHTQFTANQSPIPGNGPINQINQINIPPQAQPAIIDFLNNGLTDPRAAAESFPFDRPTLITEMQPLAQVFVNFAFDGMENGASTAPYDTLQEGLVHATSGGTLRIAAGSAPGPITINKPVTLRAQSGVVTLGASQADSRAVSTTGFVSGN